MPATAERDHLRYAVGSPQITVSADEHASHLDRRHVRYSRLLDSYRDYLTDAPTAEKVAQWWKSVDQGEYAVAVEVNEEIEAKDVHLQSVANKRRLSLTALPWRVEANEHAADQAMAQQAADFVQETFRRCNRFTDGLHHLATAIGPGIAVLELVWNRGRLVQVWPVPGYRLEGSMWGDEGVFVVTEDHMIQGIPARQPKFVVFQPQARAGFPLAVTIGRAQAYIWLIKHFVLADWAGFSEVFGVPTRIGTYTGKASTEEQAKVKDMLANIGGEGWGLFSENIKIELLETSKGAQPFMDLLGWCENKQAIGYLGQTLTTEPGVVGSLALGRVHENVQAALTLSDIENEAHVIDDQISRWVVEMRWRGQHVPVPHFVRDIETPTDTESQTLAIEKLRYMDEKGYPVDRDWVYNALGIAQPKAEPDEVPVDRPVPGF